MFPLKPMEYGWIFHEGKIFFSSGRIFRFGFSLKLRFLGSRMKSCFLQMKDEAKFKIRNRWRSLPSKLSLVRVKKIQSPLLIDVFSQASVKPVLDQAGSSLTVFLVGFKKSSEQSSWMVGLGNPMPVLNYSRRFCSGQPSRED